MAAKVVPKPAVQDLTGCEQGKFLIEVLCLKLKKKGKSKVLPRRVCLRDSEAKQRALQFLHIHCSNVNSYSSAPESNRQNPPERTMDLPFFFHCEHLTSLSNVPSPAPSESLPYWFQGNFAVCLFGITD